MPLPGHSPGNYLAEDYDIPAYYLQSSVPWPRWSNTWYLSYTQPGPRRALTGAAAYRAAIAQHHFSLVILDFLATPKTDSQIVAAMQQTGDYQVVAVVASSYGQYTIWGYRRRSNRSTNVATSERALYRSGPQTPPEVRARPACRTLR